MTLNNFNRKGLVRRTRVAHNGGSTKRPGSAAGVQGARMVEEGKCVLDGDVVILWGDGKALKRERGGGCATLWKSSWPLH